MNKANKVLNVGTLSAANIVSIAKELDNAYNTKENQLIQVKAAFAEAIAHAVRGLMRGFPEGKRTVDTAAAKIYKSRRAGVLARLSESTDRKAVENAVDYQLRKIYGGAPMSDAEKETIAEKAVKTKAATAKAMQRAKTEIKKTQPKISDELLIEKAKEIVAEKRAAANDDAVEHRRLAAWCEGIAKQSLTLADIASADVREIQLRLAAVIASVKGIMPKL